MRRCLHCTDEYFPMDILHDEDPDGAANEYAAWLSGYCTPMCQRNAALSAVANGSAWWLRGEKR